MIDNVLLSIDLEQGFFSFKKPQTATRNEHSLIARVRRTGRYDITMFYN